MEASVRKLFERNGRIKRAKGKSFMSERIKKAGKKFTSLTRKKFIGDAIFFALITCIPIAQFCIFYIGVNFNSIAMSFQSYDKANGVFSWTGFSNYAQFFSDLVSDTIWKTSFLNSTLALLFALFITKSLALLFAFYLYKQKFLSRTFRVILFIPSIISSLVTASVFAQFVDGALPKVLSDMLGKPVVGLLANDKTHFGTILFYNLWVAFGPSLIVYSSAMNSINPSLAEAAQMDGCTPFREFVSIVFPLIWPTYVVYFVATLSIYFSDSINLYAFHGSWADRSLYTFGYYLFRNAEVNKGSMEVYPYLSAIGICFTFVLAPIVLGIRKLMLKYGPSAD